MPRGLIGPLVLSLIWLTVACGTGPREAASEEPPAATAPGVPAVLETPYTAEQIRDAWVVGLSLKMMNATKFGQQYQRWTVVAADAEGADIEYVEIDAEGKRIGPPQVRRSLWIELRDHARFPSEQCTRREETRQTPLGELEGWVYTLRDDANDVVTEFFFAHSLPGAPAHMSVSQGGTIVQELIQQERDIVPGS